MFENYDDVVDIESAMLMLGVGRNKIYRLLSSKELKAFRIGRKWRIPRIFIEEYILNKCN